MREADQLFVKHYVEVVIDSKLKEHNQTVERFKDKADLLIDQIKRVECVKEQLDEVCKGLQERIERQARTIDIKKEEIEILEERIERQARTIGALQESEALKTEAIARANKSVLEKHAELKALTESLAPGPILAFPCKTCNGKGTIAIGSFGARRDCPNCFIRRLT